MKLLVVGSRNIESFELSEYISSETELIISGGAKEIDTIAEKYADKHKISKLIIRPRYDLYKKSAPIKRNEIMVDLVDEILVIWMEYQKVRNIPLIMLKRKIKFLQLYLPNNKLITIDYRKMKPLSF